MSDIGKLAAALAKAQGQMKGALKDAENPFFKSNYADLASVWDACRKALSDNELSVSQLIDTVDGSMYLRTILMHSSGENLSGLMPMQLSDKATAQQVGSLITYYRRYALSAIVGVAPEDDDGNKASETPVKSPTKKWAETAPKETSNNLKTQAIDFVKKVEMAESDGEITILINGNHNLLTALEKSLPEWSKRAQQVIAQCREAFELSKDAAE